MSSGIHFEAFVVRCSGSSSLLGGRPSGESAPSIHIPPIIQPPRWQTRGSMQGISGVPRCCSHSTRVIYYLASRSTTARPRRPGKGVPHAHWSKKKKKAKGPGPRWVVLATIEPRRSSNPTPSFPVWEWSRTVLGGTFCLPAGFAPLSLPSHLMDAGVAGNPNAPVPTGRHALTIDEREHTGTQRAPASPPDRKGFRHFGQALLGSRRPSSMSTKSPIRTPHHLAPRHQI